jgi:hypothetical protein
MVAMGGQKILLIELLVPLSHSLSDIPFRKKNKLRPLSGVEETLADFTPGRTHNIGVDIFLICTYRTFESLNKLPLKHLNSTGNYL